MSQHDPIFVTGGTGFVGSYLLRYLCRAGFTNIYALKRPASDMLLVKPVRDQVKWIEGDILDVPQLEAAMKGIKRVYHCAAVVSFANADKYQMMQVNEQGTANVVNIANDFGVEKLVHVSSIAALGRRKDKETISESSKWENSKFNSHYAISKLLAEMQVWRAAEEGLPVAIVNPSVILGGGFWSRGSGQLFSKLSNGFTFYPAGSSGFVDVRDVARYMIKLMESKVVNERIILNGENLSYRELFGAITEAFGVTPPNIRMSRLLSSLAWRAEWLRSRVTGNRAIYTRTSARITSKSFFYENMKSRKQFDFEYIPIRQTIEQTTAAYRQSTAENQPGAMLELY